MTVIPAAPDRISGPRMTLPPSPEAVRMPPGSGAEAQLVSDVVGRFAHSRRPGDLAIAEWAVGLALNSLRNGASASHACKQGRRVIERWTRLEETCGR